MDETAAGGRGDRQRGGGDREGGRDPGEAQEVLERGPASHIHLTPPRSAMARGVVRARVASEAATRRGGGRV